MRDLFTPRIFTPAAKTPAGVVRVYTLLNMAFTNRYASTTVPAESSAYTSTSMPAPVQQSGLPSGMQAAPLTCMQPCLHAKKRAHAFVHLVYINAIRTINLCLNIEQGLHVICKGLRPGALLLGAEQQHMVRCSAAISSRNHVQEGYEVLAHARRQLLGQAKVQQDKLQLRPNLLKRLVLSTDLVSLQQRRKVGNSKARSRYGVNTDNVRNAEDQLT